MNTPGSSSHNTPPRGKKTKSDPDYVFDRPPAYNGALPRQTRDLKIAYRIYGPGIPTEERLDAVYKSNSVDHDHELRRKMMHDLGIKDLEEWASLKLKAFQDYRMELRRMALAEATNRMPGIELAHKLFGSGIKSGQELFLVSCDLYNDNEKLNELGQGLGLPAGMKDEWFEVITRARDAIIPEINKSEATEVPAVRSTSGSPKTARTPDALELERAHRIYGTGIKTLDQLRLKLQSIIGTANIPKAVLQELGTVPREEVSQLLQDSFDNYSAEIERVDVQDESPSSSDGLNRSSGNGIDSHVSNSPNGDQGHEIADSHPDHHTDDSFSDFSDDQDGSSAGPHRTPEENYIPDSHWLPLDEALATVSRMVSRAADLRSLRTRLVDFYKTDVKRGRRERKVVDALGLGLEGAQECAAYASQLQEIMSHVVPSKGESGSEPPSEWAWRRTREGNEEVCEMIDRVREMDARLGAMEAAAHAAEELTAGRWAGMSAGEQDKGPRRDEWVEDWLGLLNAFALAAKEGTAKWMSLTELDDLEDEAEADPDEEVELQGQQHQQMPLVLEGGSEGNAIPLDGDDYDSDVDMELFGGPV